MAPRDCRAWALLRWGRGRAAGVLEALRAAPGAKGPRGSLGKPGPRPGRLTSARRGTRCTAHRASASVPPAPGGGPIPASGDMVSWLACCGNEVSCRCVPRRLVSAVLCSCRATASSHLHPGARIEWWTGRATSAPPEARRGRCGPLLQTLQRKRTIAASPRTRASTPSGSFHHGEVAASMPRGSPVALE
jgi:hypothetical protein